MGKMSADLDTLQRVRIVLADAMDRGLDAAESLDRAGLLRFPAQIRASQALVLEEAAKTLEETTPRQLAMPQRAALTPADTKRHVVAWLRSQAAALRMLP